MTGMVRKALTFAAGLAVVASVASAGVPDNRFSTSDAVVVGNASGTAIGGSPAGFDCTVRDVNNAPLPGRTVTLDFSATPMKVFNAQNAGTTLNCAAKTISRVTNASGAVNFASRVAKFDNATMMFGTTSNRSLGYPTNKQCIRPASEFAIITVGTFANTRSSHATARAKNE